MRKRLANYGLWVSMASLLLIVLQDFGLNINTSSYRELINAMLAVMVGLGLVNDPTTSSQWFSDD
ncbi:MAG: holin [Firmicutes bacterium]|nr:holin [Bacillota bacterium]